MQIRFTTTDDSRLWDSLVAASPGGTSFHDWSWLHLMTDMFGWRFTPLLVLRDGEPVGVFPVMMRSSLVPRAVEPPFPYVGPLVPESLLVPTLRAFRSWQVRHGRPLVRFEFGPGVAGSAERALAETRCEWHADRTITVDLVGATPESLTAGMKSNTRYHLRSGLRRGVEVRPALPGEITTLLPQLLEEAYRSRGVPSPYPADLGARLERWSAGRDDFYASTAVIDGEAVGLLVALASHPVVCGWVGGSLRAHRAASPSTVLYHDALQWALRRGHTSVDLVGYIDDGVAKFKTGFGGKEEPYLRAVSSTVPGVVRSAIGAVRART
ncbi:lipid II:glycine glycyltransferase FemX [Curtobacterium sp. NPDC089689]|uniref:lipid II:glycine glycyltransferase FemX n=1 Tax=Curtobacterium sp. NPDC089689 TaxID=3363968 RepID=UPI00381C679A